MGELASERDIVRRDQHRRAQPIDALKDTHQQHRDVIVHISGRFVGDEQIGAADDGAGDGDALLLAARQGRRPEVELAIEAHPERQRFIEHNRDALGVPALQIVAGRAPDALDGLAAPDAIFIGGGVTVPDVLDTCWERLKSGGRLVANAVTLQGEAALVAWRDSHGGTLTRIALAQAQPLGGFDTWRQALPISLLECRKP